MTTHPYTLYRATRDVSMGALRTTLKTGDPIEFNGITVRFRGVECQVPGIEAIITAGILTPVEDVPPPQGRESTTALQVVQKHLPSVPAYPIVERPSERPPLPSEDPDKAHVWEEDLFGNGAKTCKVCGVTRTGGKGFGNIRVDKISMPWQYTDAYGETIQSLHELPCPTFIGDKGGAIMGTKVDVRRVRKRLNEHDVKFESIEDRLARIEFENEWLRGELENRQQVDLSRLTSWLVGVVNQARSLQGDAPLQLEDKSLQNIIDAVLVEVPVASEVNVED